MGPNPPPKIKNGASSEILQQTKRVSVVVGAAEMPSRQLKEMARPYGAFIKLRGLIRLKSTRMQCG